MYSNNFRVAAGATASLAVAIPLIYYWLLPKPLPGIPHNPITSLLGDIPDLTQALKNNEQSIVDYFNNHVKKHGPISQMCFGNRILVLIADRGEVDRVLINGKNVDASAANRSVFAALVPTGMLSLPAGSTWKRHRRIAGPSMHRRYLSRMAIHVSAGASGLINIWKMKAKLAKDHAFEAGFDIQLATMDSMANIATGVPLGCTEKALASISPLGSSTPGIMEFSLGEINPLFAAIRLLIAKINRGLSLPFPGVILPVLLWFSSTWRVQYKILQEYLLKSIADARKRQDVAEMSKGGLTTDADCMLDMFLQQELREDTDGFESNELLDELLTLFVGGQETTATTLSWLVKYFSTNPEIQRQLHKEVIGVFGSDSNDAFQVDLEQLDNIEQMPILEAVVVETLRCVCVVAGVARILLDDEVVLGRRIPKGTEILIPTGYFGTSESEWGPDAKTWRPSRWLRTDGSFNRDAGPTGDPFGLGHRLCFGQRLALFQLKTYIVTISRAFFFKPVPGEFGSMKAVDALTRRPKMCYALLEQWDA